MNGILFLDIDGVLNRHEWLGEAESCEITPACVQQFNRIIRETGVKVVLSSAWRYMIHGGEMTLLGFSYMLRTHGVTAKMELVGLTCTDELVPDRGDQIARWLADHKEVSRYVVIDDDDGFGIERCQYWWNHPFVQTDRSQGLTEADADRAIAILNAKLEVTPCP